MANPPYFKKFMTKSSYKLPKIEELFESGAHFGHQVRRWHPSMEPYIHGVIKNIHIIDLEQTEICLKDACEFLYETAKLGGQIILVGTKRQSRDIVELEAKECGALYMTERWVGGTITNFRVIKKNMDKLVNLVRKREQGDLEKYTKKERLLIDRDIEKLQKSFGGIVNLKGVPAAIFVVDARKERTAIREANRAGVKVVALADTNADINGISYVIPGNDDAIKSVAIILKTISGAISAGYKEFGKAAEKAAKDLLAQNEALETSDVAAPKLTVTVADSLDEEILEDETKLKAIAEQVIETPIEIPTSIVEDSAEDTTKKETEPVDESTKKKSTKRVKK